MNPSSVAQHPPHRFLVVWCISFLFQMWWWYPWRPRVLASGLDNSCFYGLNEFFANGFQFGSEIIHPYGPLGFLNNVFFHPKTDTIVLVSIAVFFVVYTAMLARFVTTVTSNPTIAVLWTLGVTAVARYGDTFYLSLALLALLVFCSSPSPRDRLLWSPVALALAAAGLIKITYSLLGVVVLLLMLLSAGLTRAPVSSGHRRRLRLLSVVAWPILYLIGVVGLWMLAGQEISGLWSFVADRLHLSAIYGESHAKDGPILEVLAFTAGSLVFCFVYARVELRRVGKTAVPSVVGLGVLLLVIFKHTFMRHDVGHAVIGGLSGMCLCAILGPLMFRHEKGTAWIPGRRRVSAVLAIGLMLASCALLLVSEGRPAYGLGVFRHLDPSARARDLQYFVNRAARNRIRHERAKRWIRRDHPIPPLEGTVDIYPFDMAVVFAHELDFQPRPTLQSYQASSLRLLKANAHHLAKAAGPERILFAIDTVDNHLPAIEDGPSWPTLLSDFSLRQTNAEYLVLDRSPGRRRVEWNVGQELTTAVGAWLDVEAENSTLLWAEIKIEKTWAGRAVAALYKAPIVSIHLRVAGGGAVEYRLISGTAKAGFMLSPLVRSTADFAAVHDGRWIEELIGQRVTGIRIESTFGAGWFYRPEIVVRLRELHLKP